MSDRLHSIQVLRFVAAAMVVINHIAYVGKKTALLDPVTSSYIDFYPWGSGVDIFFVVSGFIMYYITARSPGGWRQSLHFMRGRILRVVPAYWFYTLVMLMAVVFVDRELMGDAVGADFVWYVLASFFFISWPNPSDGSLAPLLGQGWTLNFEMYFYLVFAMALTFATKSKVVFCSIVIVAVCIIGALLRNHISSTMSFYAATITLEFLFGLLIARYTKLGLLNPSVKTSTFFIILAFALLWLVGVQEYYYPAGDPAAIRFMTRGIPAAIVVVGVIGLNRLVDIHRPVMMWLERLGDSSYSLYLSHVFVLHFLAIALHKVPYGDLLFVAISLPLSAGVGLLSWATIEKPRQGFELTKVTINRIGASLTAWRRSLS